MSKDGDNATVSRKRIREEDSLNNTLPRPPPPRPSPPNNNAVNNNNNLSESSSTHHVPTPKQFLAEPSQYTTLPKELENVDFTQRISWRKYAPYPIEPSDSDDGNTAHPPLPLTPASTPPVFHPSTPALCFHVHAVDGRARSTTIHLSPLDPSSLRRRNSVPTPIFMPVGTKGTIKSLTTEEIVEDPALDCPIILANTYHLALQPGTELLRDLGGIHRFMGWDRPLLTDSGGFQMVSLLKFAEITEEGVTFENPFEAAEKFSSNGTVSIPVEDKSVKNHSQHDQPTSVDHSNSEDKTSTQSPIPTPNEADDGKQHPTTTKKPSRMLLRPEDSITHQNNIGSSIIMALDDVVSSLDTSPIRHRTATFRTLRWLDRCRLAHSKPHVQNLFPIVQGGLDTSMGGLRELCLAGFRARDGDGSTPGYAIGGLAGGESKDDFWRVVDRCCRALPDDRPRYLMGVGYPLDLVVCTALGVDMYDCVYPTRTARFGVALVDGRVAEGGTMRLKSNIYGMDEGVIEEGCECPACKGGYSRGRLHGLLKTANPVAATLISGHNLAYMMRLVRGMKKAIEEGMYGDFVRKFVEGMFQKSEEVPKWVREALAAAGIEL